MKVKKILIVAMGNSVHTMRWINQFIDTDEFELHLFSSVNKGYHNNLKNVIIHDINITTRPNTAKGKICAKLLLKLNSTYITEMANKIYRIAKYGKCKSDYEYRTVALAKLINNMRPSIIHTLEMQHSAYLVLSAKRYIKENMPKWLLTPWGSDIYLYWKLDEHKERINMIMKLINGYIPQSLRDVKLARNINPNVNVLPQIITNAGYKMNDYLEKRNSIQTSSRTNILLKGYQGWAGRALCALKGMRYLEKELAKYTIYIYLPSDEVELYSKILMAETTIKINIIKYTSQERILDLQSSAKISLGLSISDGIPNSLLEAMLMGSFPIESIQGCGEELIRHKQNGMIVDPEEPREIAQAILYAIEQDAIVDTAAIINWKIVEQYAEYNRLKNLARKIYINTMRENE